MIEIVSIVYKGVNQYGDFNWMIKQKEYEDSLFIFNDNEEYHSTNERGGGNAIIRFYNQHNKSLTKPHSAGIPTGTLKYGGYTTLDRMSRAVIDFSINEIKDLIKKYRYRRIFYSSTVKNDCLGTGIFTVDDNVIYYITSEIWKLRDFVF